MLSRALVLLALLSFGLDKFLWAQLPALFAFRMPDAFAWFPSCNDSIAVSTMTDTRMPGSKSRLKHRQQSRDETGRRDGRTRHMSPSPARESTRHSSHPDRGRRHRQDVSPHSEDDSEREQRHQRVRDRDTRIKGERARQTSPRIPSELYAARMRSQEKTHSDWGDERAEKENLINRGPDQHSHHPHPLQMKDPFQEMMARLEGVLPTNPPAHTYRPVSPVIGQDEKERTGQHRSPLGSSLVPPVEPRYQDDNVPRYPSWSPAAQSFAYQHHIQEFDESNRHTSPEKIHSKEDISQRDWKSKFDSSIQKEPLPGTWKFHTEHSSAEPASSMAQKGVSPLGLEVSILQDMQVCRM